MKKNVSALLIFCLSLSFVYGQNTLKTGSQVSDSAALVKGLVKGFCDKLGENVKLGHISLPYLSQTGINSLFTEDNMDAMKDLSGNHSVDDSEMSFALMEKGFRIALKASFDNCPLVDTFLNYDGRQRPAYAHVSQAICRCMGEKKRSFKDPELAQYKYGYIRDSCFLEVFRDPEELKIIHAANDFQTKAEIDAFDKNFQGYFFKNCSESFEAIMYGYKAMFAEMEKQQATNKTLTSQPQTVSESRQSESMMHILHLITPTLGLSSDRKMVDMFASAATYRTAVSTINNAKLRFKNNLVVDYMPNMTQRSDGITEHRYTMYQYFPKTKKHTIICQFIFEFEGTSELIGAFRYIDRTQIANLETLQRQLEEQSAKYKR
jgi:hypothetical protein